MEPETPESDSAATVLRGGFGGIMRPHLTDTVPLKVSQKIEKQRNAAISQLRDLRESLDTFKCPNSGYDCGYPACAHADQCRKHPVAVQTYTIAEIADYIAGCSMAPYEEVKKVGAATLSIALSQLKDDHTGIEAVRQRKIHSENVIGEPLRCDAQFDHTAGSESAPPPCSPSSD